jgi:hypothetical protein
MAKPILEDSALDYTKPFTVEFTFRDADGWTYRIEKLTHPMTSMVKNMAERGMRAPWDQEVRS